MTLTESVRAQLQDASPTQNCDGPAQNSSLVKLNPPAVGQVNLTFTGEDSRFNTHIKSSFRKFSSNLHLMN